MNEAFLVANASPELVVGPPAAFPTSSREVNKVVLDAAVVVITLWKKRTSIASEAFWNRSDGWFRRLGKSAAGYGCNNNYADKNTFHPKISSTERSIFAITCDKAFSPRWNILTVP